MPSKLIIPLLGGFQSCPEVKFVHFTHISLGDNVPFRFGIHIDLPQKKLMSPSYILPNQGKTQI